MPSYLLRHHSPFCSVFGKRGWAMWPRPSKMAIFSWKVHNTPKKLCQTKTYLEGSMSEGYLAKEAFLLWEVVTMGVSKNEECLECNNIAWFELDFLPKMFEKQRIELSTYEYV